MKKHSVRWFCATAASILLLSGDLYAQKLRVVDDALNLLVVGDWGRNGQENQDSVAATMGRVGKELDIEAVISTGDNFYPNGVQSLEDPQWFVSFENVYTAHSLNVPWYVIMGNHDYRGNVDAQLEYSRRSRRWVAPARYFSTLMWLDDDVKKESVEFFFIDTNPFIQDYQAQPEEYLGIRQQDTTGQLRWLDSALGASQATYKIVVGHHHIYSGGKRKEQQHELVRLIVPMLRKHGVHAYFNGHEHDLQHIRREGMDYFVSGAGSEVRKTGRIEGTQYAEAVPGFMSISFTPDILLVQIIAADGSVRHTVEIPAKKR